MFFDIKQDFAANAVAMELVTEKCSKRVVRSNRLCDDQSGGGNETCKSERTSVDVGGTSEGGRGNTGGRAVNHVSFSTFPRLPKE
jgi:hypothetical protein